MSRIHIRKATPKDLKAVYSLVKELADYEKASDQVTATLENYQRDFEAGWFESIIALSNEDIIGMILYYKSYSTWKGKMLYLEDFVVKETHRQKGVGQMLFDHFMKIAKEKGAKITKWQVLDWNTPAIEFYKKNQAIMEKNWWNVKLFLS